LWSFFLLNERFRSLSLTYIYIYIYIYILFFSTNKLSRKLQ